MYKINLQKKQAGRVQNTLDRHKVEIQSGTPLQPLPNEDFTPHSTELSSSHRNKVRAVGFGPTRRLF